jgi:predicted nuclease with TOPRIM domain
LAQQSDNAQTKALFERQQENAEFSKRDLEARALKANTISPGEMVLGDVRLALPKRNKAAPSEFVATVNVDGESVAFVFREQQ